MKHKHSPLTVTLYTYATPINVRFAKSFGKRKFGSMSAYVDHLIAADRKRVALREDRRYLPRG